MNAKPTVVIIDDEADVVTYLGTALRDHGFRVLGTGEIGEGIGFIKRLRPAVVCLDLLMPGRTGLSLYREMRTDPALRQIPVLFISGLDMEAEIGRRLGELPPPEGYMEKPVDIEQFVALVRRLTAKDEDAAQ
jgi:CheY-like chemotaxis protein